MLFRSKKKNSALASLGVVCHRDDTIFDGMNAVASKRNSPEYNEPSAQVNTPALASLGGVCRHDDIIFDNKDAVSSFKKEITNRT